MLPRDHLASSGDASAYHALGGATSTRWGERGQRCRLLRSVVRSPESSGPNVRDAHVEKTCFSEPSGGSLFARGPSMNPKFRIPDLSDLNGLVQNTHY